MIFSRLLVFTLTFAIALLSEAATGAFTYEGYLTDVNGPVTNTEQFQFTITGHDANGACRLYLQTNSGIPVVDGQFAVAINGSGTYYGPSTLAALFDTTKSNIAGNGCVFDATAAGSTWTLDVAHGASNTAMGSIAISAAPRALQADQVGGFTSANLLRVANSGVPQAIAPLSSTNFTELTALLSGSSTHYIPSTGTGALLPNLSSNTPTTGGQMWFDSTSNQIKFYDGTSTQTLGTSSTSGSVQSVGAGTGLTGGPITTNGTLSLAAIGSGGTGVTKITYDNFGRVTSSGSITGSDITSGTIGGSTAMTTTGNVSATNVSASTASVTQLSIFKSDNTAQVIVSASPTMPGNYILVLPDDGGSPGQMLTSGGSGILQWAYPSNGSVTSVGLSVPSYMNSSGGPVTSSGNLTLGFGSQNAKTIFAAPQAAAGAPSFRALTIADVQSSSSGSFLTASGGCAIGQMLTYSSVSDTLGCAAYSVTMAQVTSALGGTPVRNAGGAVSLQQDILASRPTPGTVGREYLATDTKQIFRDNGTSWDLIASTAATDLTGTLNTAQLPVVPVTKGGTGLSSPPSNGQLLIGNGTGYSSATITAGSGVAVANSAGGITISATGSGGTVTSISSGTGLLGGPITTSGAFSVDVGTTAGKIVQLDPSAKLPAVDGSLLTNLNASNLASGTISAARFPALTGDVTTTAGSVAATVGRIQSVPVTITAITSGNYLKYNGTAWVNVLPSSADLSDAGSLIKSSQMPGNCSASQTLTFSSPTGTWACSTIAVSGTNFGSQTQGMFLASPTSAAGLPAFRGIASSDLPSLASGFSGILPLANGGTGTINGSITGTSALVFAAGGTNQNVTLSPSGTGSTILYGNVGIGTISPSAVLDMVSASNSPLGLVRTTNTSGGASVKVGYGMSNGSDTASYSLAGNGSSRALIFDSTTPAGYTFRQTNANGGYTFQTGTSNATVMSILNSGNVGINVATPAAKLQVGGSAVFGSVGETCSSVLKGALQVSPSNNGMEYCDGINWVGLLLNGGNTLGAAAEVGTKNGSYLSLMVSGTDQVGIDQYGAVFMKDNASLNWGSGSPAQISGNSSDQKIIFAPAGVERVRMTANSVGIGTQNPTATLDVYGTSKAKHFQGGGGTPTAINGTGAGTGASVSVTGSDTAGIVSVTTGSAPTLGNLIFISFNTAFGTPPFCVLTANNSQAASVNFYVTTTTTDMTVSTNGALGSSSTYKWMYSCLQ